MFGIKLPLKPLVEGECDIWAKVNVKLAEPIPNADEPSQPPVVGYYRVFGIRLRGSEPQRLLERLIDDGSIVWPDSEYQEVDPFSLDRTVRKKIVAPDEFGVWYRTGRIFYPADNGAG